MRVRIASPRWALRYSNWLEDRVRLNRVRTRQLLLEIELADDTRVAERKRQVPKKGPKTPSAPASTSTVRAKR